MFDFNPDYSVSPGQVLRDLLEEQGMSQPDLAARTDLTVKTLNQIINGSAPLTYETAQKLEMALGVAAGFWNNLESRYRDDQLQRSVQSKLSSMKAWLKDIPVKELVDRGFIDATDDPGLLIKRTLKFFGVSSVNAWKTVWLKPQVQFRGSKSQVTYPGKVAAWIRMGEHRAKDIQCSPYDATAFKQVVRDVRPLTRLPGADGFAKAVKLCATAGVALVMVKEIANASVSGVTKWLSKDKCVIMLSLKFKTNDQFWFSFFHEAGHILKHGKKQVFVDDGMSDDTVEEKEANSFARDTLIPQAYLPQLRRLKSKKDIRRFARMLDIADGIVVGRLQREKFIPHSHCNDLKRKYAWTE
ncbi:MAG: hypothetical protein CMJ78_05005 [Planctomycetaceae bacterium]|nr:hypothetical protein [Planctomycetaceae bacterium]